VWIIEHGGRQDFIGLMRLAGAGRADLWQAQETWNLSGRLVRRTGSFERGHFEPQFIQASARTWTILSGASLAGPD
jgi:hypothetical protein